MNLLVMAIKKPTAIYLFSYFSIYSRNIYLTAAVCQALRRIGRMRPAITEHIVLFHIYPFGNHRPMLDVATNSYTLQSRNQKFFLPRNHHPQDVSKILCKAALDYSSMPDGIPWLANCKLTVRIFGFLSSTTWSSRESGVRIGTH